MKPSLSCAGNALYTVVAFVETGFASKLGLHPSSKNTLDSAALLSMINSLPDAAKGAGGGAAACARVFAALGNKAAFAGCLGNDSLASLYKKDMVLAGISDFTQQKDGYTGSFCALIEPGGVRTIAVNPGIATSINPELIDPSFYNPDSTLYMDGFLSDYPETIMAIVKKAVSAGMRVALDVASFSCVKKEHNLFLDLIRNYCSWTFMNEDEFNNLADGPVDTALKAFSMKAPGTIIVKRAEVGAVCVSDGLVLESAVRPFRAADKTGAGDAFAAGFLSAALQGAPLARCLRLGNRVAELTLKTQGFAIDSESFRQAVKAVI